MIYQLPNGSFIELSIEEFLSMDDQDIRDLNGLPLYSLTEFDDPFIDVFNSTEILEIEEDAELDKDIDFEDIEPD